MKAILFAALLPIVLAGAAQLPLENSQTTGTVEGTVRRSDTGEGIENVAVALVGPGGDRITLLRNTSLRTDRNGHFAFKNVEPTTYSLAVGREGYFKPGDDLFTFEAPPTVVVGRGQRVADVVAELTPLATISGRVLDATGEPLVGATVVAGKYYYDEKGRRALVLSAETRGGDMSQPSTFATTDERGEYRIFQLYPGTYYVGIAYRLRRAGATSDVYFPGTFDERVATPIVAKPGEEAAGISFRIPLALDIATYTVSGTVVGDPALLEKPVEVLYLVSRKGERFEARAMSNLAGDRAQGRFQIRGVAPGDYDLYPEVRDKQGGTFTGKMRLEVRDRDLKDIRVALQPGVDLRGRIVMDGVFPPTTFLGETFAEYLKGGPTVSLVSEDGIPREVLNTRQDPEKPFIDPSTGSFTYRQLLPGRYKLEFLTILPNGAYFGDVRQNARSVFDDGVTIGTETPNPAEVVIKTGAVNVEGTVQDAALQPVVRAFVALVPPMSQRANPARYREGWADRNGRFRIQNVPPGEYKIFAWRSIPMRAQLNIEFMKDYEQYGTSVRIESAGTGLLQVPVVPEAKR